MGKLGGRLLCKTSSYHIKLTTISIQCPSLKRRKTSLFACQKTMMILKQSWSIGSVSVSTDVHKKYLLWSVAPQDVTTGVSWLDRQAADMEGRTEEEERRGGRKESQGFGGGGVSGKKNRETVETIWDMKVRNHKQTQAPYYSGATSDGWKLFGVWAYTQTHTHTPLSVEGHETGRLQINSHQGRIK